METLDRNIPVPSPPRLDDVAAHVTAIRHDLHRHPELGYQEHYTSGVVAAELARLGITHRTGLGGGTGILATIPGGAGPGKCVALRADMDALPIHEATGLPYASLTPGRMHACGHDGHTAILLGAAAMLHAMAAALPGTIKLIFQPAEEGMAGADKMCRDDVLENPPVQAIFGLHGWPEMAVGTASTRGGPLLASVDILQITVTGLGTHAAAPHHGVDPIVCGSAIVAALQTIASREIDPTDALVVTIGKFHAGSAFNIIPDQAVLTGTIRALTETTRRAAWEAVRRICRGVAEAHRCRCEVVFTESSPPTVNTPHLADFFRDTARQELGQGGYISGAKPHMWGEDFAYYLNRVPGCFYLLGVRPPDRGDYPMLHNAHYDFTDAAIPVGIRLMTALARRFLES